MLNWGAKFEDGVVFKRKPRVELEFSTLVWKNISENDGNTRDFWGDIWLSNEKRKESKHIEMKVNEELKWKSNVRWNLGTEFISNVSDIYGANK